MSEYSYDQFGRLTGLVHYQDPENPLAEYSWTYEGGSGRTEATSTYEPLPDYAWTFDAAVTGRLVQMTSSDGGKKRCQEPFPAEIAG